MTLDQFCHLALILGIALTAWGADKEIVL